MSYIKLEKDEPIDKAIYRFKKQCGIDGITEENKKRAYFRNKKQIRMFKYINRLLFKKKFEKVR